MFCSDPMSGSHFIAQTSKFLLNDATDVTLGQGHRNVTQYISPDSYILCAKYLSFSSNHFDVRDKSCCGGGHGGGQGRGGKELKTLSHPRLGWLNYYHTYITQISIYVINNMPGPGRNLAADACMGRTQPSPCIISVPGHSMPTGMPCQHDIIFMLSHLYADFLRNYT